MPANQLIDQRQAGPLPGMSNNCFKSARFGFDEIHDR